MATRRRSKRVKIDHSESRDEYHALISVWVLRMLLGSAAAFKGFFEKKRGFMDDDLRELLGFSDKNEQELKVSAVKESLHSRLLKNEKKLDASATLFANIALMAKRIPLSAIQQQVLALVVLKQRYEPLKGCFERLHTPSEMHLYAALAKTLESDAGTVAKAMAGSAALRASGLIKIDDNYRSGLDLEPMDGLVEALMSENESEDALLRHFLVPAKAATLQASDYPHVHADVVLLETMLSASFKQQEKGVNILVYGTQGSGKTELARLLAQNIGAQLFEVKTEDDDPVRSNQRMGGIDFASRCSPATTMPVSLHG